MKSSGFKRLQKLAVIAVLSGTMSGYSVQEVRADKHTFVGITNATAKLRTGTALNQETEKTSVLANVKLTLEPVGTKKIWYKITDDCSEANMLDELCDIRNKTNAWKGLVVHNTVIYVTSKEEISICQNLFTQDKNIHKNVNKKGNKTGYLEMVRCLQGEKQVNRLYDFLEANQGRLTADSTKVLWLQIDENSKKNYKPNKLDKWIKELNKIDIKAKAILASKTEITVPKLENKKPEKQVKPTLKKGGADSGPAKEKPPNEPKETTPTKSTSKGLEPLRKTLTSLQKTVKGLEKQITTTKTRLNINQTKHDKNIDALQKEINKLRTENKNLNKKLGKVESTSKNARKTLEKKQTTLENEVAGFDKLFRETVGRNNAIRKSMSDIETRSKMNEKAIENIRKRPGSKEEIKSSELKADPKTPTEEPTGDQKGAKTETPGKPTPSIESTDNDQPQPKDDDLERSVWFFIALAGFVAAGLGGLGFMFWKRNADRTREQREREDELRMMRSGRNRSSGETSNFSQNDYEHIDNVLSGATDGSRGDLDVPSDTRGRQDDGTTFSAEDKKTDPMGFYRDALTNPEELKRIKELGTVIGVSMAPGHGNEELATLEKDTLPSIDGSDFWAIDLNEGNYAILPGIKQNINAAYLVSDDGRTAEKEFRGIFDIRPGISFELERHAEAEGDGSTFKITRKGVVQLPK